MRQSSDTRFANLEKEMERVKADIEQIIPYTIAYFKRNPAHAPVPGAICFYGK